MLHLNVHFAYCCNHYGMMSHLRAKYGKSPPKILSIFNPLWHKFSPNVLIWSKYLGVMETTGWHLFIDMCFVLVYCYVGMLMTSRLWGATPILGRKRLPQPKAIHCICPIIEIYICVMKAHCHCRWKHKIFRRKLTHVVLVRVMLAEKKLCKGLKCWTVV